MELYYHPLSRYSQKVLLALYEKQANFFPRVTDLQDPLERQHYLHFYPSGKLPLLVCQNGSLLPESSIIIEYLDNKMDAGTRLLPKEPELNLQVRLYDRIADNDLNNSLYQLEQQYSLPEEQQLSLVQRQIENRLRLCLRALDLRLVEHHWLCGDGFTLADCALIPCLGYLQRSFNLLDYQHLGRYWLQAQLRGSWMLVQDEVTLAQEEASSGLRPIP
ncbi:glutathione S-transferase family protein [Shewanella chilikensis]|uniref:glutathione S-transferase family protein n=1 Tax=Shewanella chilikensis TaxID=558541 RepID=UPI001F260034|nr:glutathione S-transferase family protein [Shewanella chilikensis]MCE9852174.1 glutathione S-transferase family protein [Shewanella chilikensis]